MPEIEDELPPDGWSTLRAVRVADRATQRLNRDICAHLAARGLIEQGPNGWQLTVRGRRTLVRGSCQLLDLAA